MAKVDCLGWTSGIVLRLLGERIGVRVNCDQALDAVLAVASAQDWNYEQSGETVDLLYSLRISPPSSRKGHRNYHLLYVLSGRVSRTLEKAELLRDFEQSVWAMAALMAQKHILLCGFAELVGDACVLTLLPLGEEIRADRAGEAKNSLVAGRYLELNPQGQLISGGAPLDVTSIRVPASPNRNGAATRLSPGELSLRLLQSSVTPTARLLPIATSLATKIPAYERSLNGSSASTQQTKVKKVRL